MMMATEGAIVMATRVVGSEEGEGNRDGDGNEGGDGNGNKVADV